MGNTLGKLFSVTSFGESHGKCVGVVIDGCPAGLQLTVEDIQREVDRRRPRPGTFATTRYEEDRVEILSGVFDEYTTGAPICLLVYNAEAESGVYEEMKNLLRPGHADYTARIKYGGFADYRGGGRFSGRITAGFVMAGAVAKKLLIAIGVEILAHTVEIGGIRAGLKTFPEIRENVNKNHLCTGDPGAVESMLRVIARAREAGDSVGGVVEGIALNVPAGLGEPIFDTLEGEIAKALLAIPAVKGVEFGAGFQSARMFGSENNDPFVLENGRLVTVSNNAGGVLGGISSGMPIVVRVAVKPTPSIARSQDTVNIRDKQPAKLEIKGRHDTCIVPRVVPVVEAMMAIVLCDFALVAGKLPRVLVRQEER